MGRYLVLALEQRVSCGAHPLLAEHGCLRSLGWCSSYVVAYLHKYALIGPSINAPPAPAQDAPEEEMISAHHRDVWLTKFGTKAGCSRVAHMLFLPVCLTCILLNSFVFQSKQSYTESQTISNETTICRSLTKKARILQGSEEDIVIYSSQIHRHARSAAGTCTSAASSFFMVKL